MIHCGVSAKATGVTLEACAYNFGYCRPDVNNKCLAGNYAELTQNGKGKKILLTTIDIDRIAAELNGVKVGDDCECRSDAEPQSSGETDSKFVTSRDVGSYLCGYIYMKSLDYDLDRSLFIHVPEINKPLSSEEAAKGIFEVVKKCLEQLNAKNL